MVILLFYYLYYLFDFKKRLMYSIYLLVYMYTYICVFRNHPALLKITSSLVWSWRQLTGRTLTWFVLPPLERSEVRRFLSCLTAGEEPSTTGAPSTPETSSPLAGVPLRNTAYSRLETSVSVLLLSLFSCHALCEMCSLFLTYKSWRLWIPRAVSSFVSQEQKMSLISQVSSMNFIVQSHLLTITGCSYRSYYH